MNEKGSNSINALRTVFINFNFCLYYASVVLLDTTKEATLGKLNSRRFSVPNHDRSRFALEWTRYPYGPQAQTPGVS